jgi:hypothetical protein
MVGLQLKRGETRKDRARPPRAHSGEEPVARSRYRTRPHGAGVAHRRRLLRAGLPRRQGPHAGAPLDLPHRHRGHLAHDARRDPASRPPGLPGALADCDVAERRRLRGDRPVEPGVRDTSGLLVPHQRHRPRRDPRRRAPRARPRPLPLPDPDGRDGAAPHAAHPPLRTEHQRRSSVGRRRADLLPACRNRQDPARLLLRFVLCRQPRAALHADATPRGAQHRGAEGSAADPLRLGHLNGDRRCRERHRLRPLALRAVHLAALGHDGPEDLRGARRDAVRRGLPRGRAVLHPSPLASLVVAQPLDPLRGPPAPGSDSANRATSPFSPRT